MSFDRTVNDPGFDLGFDWPVKDPYGTGLWEHQRRELSRSYRHAAHYFAFDPGLGKTATVIAEAGAMFLDGEIDTLIVVAPNRVHRQWVEKQFPLWADFPWHGWVWPNGGLSSERRRQVLDAALQVRVIRPRLRVFTFNFESIRIPKGRNPKIQEAFRVIERIFATSKLGVYVAGDELHRIKDHAAAQSRALLRLGRGKAKVRRGLSGTPILQGMHDLYAQYAFLDPAIIGEESFFSFRTRFCRTAPVPGRQNAVRIVGPRNEDILMSRIAPFTSRVLAAEALDMPPQSFDFLEVDMSPAQAKAYATMQEIMMVGLQETGQVISAKIVIAQLQKLHQISSGFVFDEDRQVHWLSLEKVEAIADRIDDLNRPVVVWAPWVPLIDKIEEVLEKRGGVVRYRQLSDVDRWRAKGTGRNPILANPASGGTGVDGMQFASWAIYAANTFSLEHRDQSIKRTHRGDQKEHCFYLDAVTRGSRDLVAVDTLKAKKDISAMTIDQLREFVMGSLL